MIEVCIKLDDQGQYSVGVEPATEESTDQAMGGQMGAAPPATAGTMDMMAGGQGAAPESAEQYTPAKNLDDALAQAKQLLMQSAGAEMIQERNDVANQVWPGQ